MEQVFNNIVNNFDFSFIIVVNLITYFFIKLIEDVMQNIHVTIFWKRVILLASIIISALVYIWCGYDNKIILLNSAIASPVAWSWIIRPIFVKFGFGYKQKV